MKINDKVKLLKKNEGSNSLVEISRGIVLSIAYGKNTNWVKYLPRETENPDCAEWIAINAPNIKIVNL